MLTSDIQQCILLFFGEEETTVLLVFLSLAAASNCSLFLINCKKSTTSHTVDKLGIFHKIVMTKDEIITTILKCVQ